MRIVYDGKIFQLQPAGGVNRYFANVISRLPNTFSPTLIADQVREVNYPTHSNLTLHQLGRLRFPRVSYRLSTYYSKLEDAMLRRRLGRGTFDLFHPTYYSRLIQTRVKAPTVITVWDMIHEVFAKQIDSDGSHAELKRRAILSADHVICISQCTKRDLLSRYPVAENKISVTYLAADINATVSHGPELVPERPYYLYVGSRASYKNFDRLLRAFAKANEAVRDLALCVVGVDFTEHERRLISELKLGQDIYHYGHPLDTHLAKLYRCSIALVYPSLYEGFGIPPLEAMACGTVAIASNVASLPEVVGNAGILFDPHSEEELESILRSLPADEALRAQLISKGRERAQEFSWESTVAQTVQIYRSIVSLEVNHF